MSEPEQRDPSSQRRSAGPFVKQLSIKNYKSIGTCSASLGCLTVLVGRNGAGKSNFLDALRFVADSLQTSLDHAIKSRGGIDEVRRRSTGHPRNLAVYLKMELPDQRSAHYGFEIAAKKKGGFSVKKERLDIRSPSGDRIVASYRLEEGELMHSAPAGMPASLDDRLYLVNASGLPEFRDVYDGLLSMGFYNLNPQAMKELQSPDAGKLLRRDGGNIASVIARITAENRGTKDRIQSYLDKIVPDITDLKRVALGPRETLEFRQAVVGAKHPWRFHAASMSDGTLRALGTLVAVTQLAERKDPVRLVGIEEPETALHPAAAGALMDAVREAREHTQVLVTTHSSDLVDEIDTNVDTLLAVQSRKGATEIAPVDSACREAIKSHLYSPGELLRMDQLQPDQEDLKRQEQQKTFDFPEGEVL